MKEIGSDSVIQTYRWAAFVLRVGMYASFAAMGGGLAWWLASGAPGGHESGSKSVPINAILPQLAAGNPLALLNLGVLLLLATPGLTLLAEIITFVSARNWRYVAIASVVAAILLTSIAFSLKWITLF